MTARLVACFLLMPALAAQGQGGEGGEGGLAAAARSAQAAWLAHDPQALVGQSAAVVLQIPNANASAPLGRAQAVELLRRYLGTATERAVAVRSAREVAPGTGFVELEREYAVRGTKDVRRETLFCRFRAVGDHWELTELRAAP